TADAMRVYGVALEKFILFIQLVMEYRMKNKQQQGLRSDQKHNTFTPIYPAILEIFIVLQQDGTGHVSNVDLHCVFFIDLRATCLRSRMIIQIDDGTSSLCTTLCAPDIEKTVPYTTVELKQADEHNIFISPCSTLKRQTLVIVANSVPNKFLPIVASIEQYSEIDTMSFEEAMGRIITFEERIKSQDEPEENYQNKLLMARSSNQNHGNGRGRNLSKGEKGCGTSFQQSTREQNKNKMRCYECGDLGIDVDWDIPDEVKKRTSKNSQVFIWTAV
ncbi:hypothetical protein Tco_0884199, partial [Tanacetum coccineum]